MINNLSFIIFDNKKNRQKLKSQSIGLNEIPSLVGEKIKYK